MVHRAALKAQPVRLRTLAGRRRGGPPPAAGFRPAQIALGTGLPGLPLAPFFSAFLPHSGAAERRQPAASRRVGDALRFEQSLFIASTVMNVGSGDRVVLDAGLKSVAVDSGLPGIWCGGADSPTLVYTAANDEHGIVRARAPGDAHPALGSQLLLVPGHCDPTLNLHDELIGVRGGLVENIWLIAARGLSR